MSPQLVVGAALAAVAVAIGTYWFVGYDARSFRGAGPMRDTGLFSYYRYHAPLGTIPFAQPGRHVLRFSGIPAVEMTLRLYLPAGLERNWPLLDSLQLLRTNISAEFVDSQGKAVCRAAGTPEKSYLSRWWVLMRSSYDAAFWHHDCRAVRFKERTDYELHLSITDVDPRSPPVQLTVMLEGGGIELP